MHYDVAAAEPYTLEIHTLGNDDSGAGPRYAVYNGDTDNYVIGKDSFLCSFVSISFIL